MITLNLVRHGQTEMNKADVVQSRTPGDLTPLGIQMAESLGHYLKNEKFDLVYTSDLKRCVDTTANILKYNEKNPPEPKAVPILRERDYGDLEFKSGNLVRDLMALHGLANHVVPLPGGESHEDVMKRCDQFFSEICEVADRAEEHKNVLAVTHGAWILCFIDYLMANTNKYEVKGIDEKAYSAPLNTGHTILEIGKLDPLSNNNETKRSIVLRQVHGVQHLNGLL